MILRTVDAAIRELQIAVLARALYPPDHPKIAKSEDRARAMLAEALGARKEITVFALDDRVVFDGEVLPTSESLLGSLFRILGCRGVNQITFREGLGEGELRAFLNSVAATGKPGAGPLEAGSHIGFGTLTASDGHDDTPMVLPEVGAVPLPYDEAPTALGDVWDGIRSRQSLDAGVLGDIISGLSQAVLDSAGAILPLAPLKSHDEYTFTHILNVSLLTMALAEALGFDANATHEVGLAALLHDVGKLAVPLDVLNKSGRFTEKEFRAIQVHPVEGARILLRTPGVPEIAAIVAYEHHVRFDGGGYPRVPRGWKLNLASRITQVADVFDALRTHRPYRPGMPLDRIVQIMRNDAGTYFDPDLLDIFLSQVAVRGVPEARAPEDSIPPSPASA